MEREVRPFTHNGQLFSREDQLPQEVVKLGRSRSASRRLAGERDTSLASLGSASYHVFWAAARDAHQTAPSSHSFVTARDADDPFKIPVIIF